MGDTHEWPGGTVTADHVAQALRHQEDINGWPVHWEDALPEIGFSCLDHRIRDHLEPFHDLTSTISPDWFVWRRWSPGETDGYLGHCSPLQKRHSV